MRVTRIAYCKNLNKSKLLQLQTFAKKLGQIRSEVWQRFGSIKGVGKKDRAVRDEWLKAGRTFDVPANAWKETLRDAMADIHANRESAKVKARRAISICKNDSLEKKELFRLLVIDKWTEKTALRRIMRKACPRGHNRTHNQIIVRSDDYTVFTLKDTVWIKISGLEKGKRIALPLTTTHPPSGTLRLIIKDYVIEVHFSIEVEQTVNHGTETLGIDKGYTEAFVDSSGERYGQALGEALTEESDSLKIKYQRRNKIKSIAEKKTHKKQTILKNNLGRKKLIKRKVKKQFQIKDIIHKAVHKLVDKAKTIAAEDLTAPMVGKKLFKDASRRLSSWTKGVIANALELISQRRGSTLVLVNAAYTSQVDSRNGALIGERKGDSFHCYDGEVLDADINAALNNLARLNDPEIDRWTPYKKVKAILLERTKRLGLLNQDSSCSDTSLSTESELPNGQLCPTF
jgi:IS605 OrfB family transposase